jgi:hypothetical protein
MPKMQAVRVSKAGADFELVEQPVPVPSTKSWQLFGTKVVQEFDSRGYEVEGPRVTHAQPWMLSQSSVAEPSSLLARTTVTARVGSPGCDALSCLLLRQAELRRLQDSVIRQLMTRYRKKSCLHSENQQRRWVRVDSAAGPTTAPPRRIGETGSNPLT